MSDGSSFQAASSATAGFGGCKDDWSTWGGWVASSTPSWDDEHTLNRSSCSDLSALAAVNENLRARTSPRSIRESPQESPMTAMSVSSCRSRILRGNMEARGIVKRATKQFAQTVEGRIGDDVLTLWEKWSDRLDIRCAGTALRSFAKSAFVNTGNDCEVDCARLSHLV